MSWFCFRPKDDRIIEDAMHLWRSHAILREGYKPTAYLDSRKFLTVGIGHLVLEKDKIVLGQRISDQRIIDLFEADSKQALERALRQAKEIKKLTPEFLAALISVNFQLGDFSVKFYGTYPKLVNGDWVGAIEGIRKSDWHKQTPVRTEDFIKAIQTAFKGE